MTFSGLIHFSCMFKSCWNTNSFYKLIIATKIREKIITFINILCPGIISIFELFMNITFTIALPLVIPATFQCLVRQSDMHRSSFKLRKSTRVFSITEFCEYFKVFVTSVASEYLFTHSFIYENFIIKLINKEYISLLSH